MRPKLMLVKLDSKYCDYLRKYDSKVPYNYDRKKNRPFVGYYLKLMILNILHHFLVQRLNI